jgi:hypothetical protein
VSKAAAVKAADHPLFGTPEMVKFQRKDGSELVCRTVLNDVWMGAREKETSHLLLYIEECDPAAQAEMYVREGFTQNTQRSCFIGNGGALSLS